MRGPESTHQKHHFPLSQELQRYVSVEIRRLLTAKSISTRFMSRRMGCFLAHAVTILPCQVSYTQAEQIFVSILAFWAYHRTSVALPRVQYQCAYSWNVLCIPDLAPSTSQVSVDLWHSPFYLGRMQEPLSKWDQRSCVRSDIYLQLLRTAGFKASIRAAVDRPA